MAIGVQGAQAFGQAFSQNIGTAFQNKANQDRQQQEDEQRDAEFKTMQATQKDLARRQFSEDYMSHVFEADIYSNSKPLTQFMRQHKEEFKDGQIIRGLTDSDIYGAHNPDDGIPANTRQRYFDETGENLPADNKEALAVLKNSLMLDDDVGNDRYISKKHLGLAMGNYNTYREKKLRSMGGDGGMSKGQLAATYKTTSDVKGFSKLDNQTQNEAIAAYQDAGVLKTYMRQDLVKPGIIRSTNYASKEGWNPEAITQADKELAFKMQSGAEYEYGNRPARLDEINTVASFTRVQGLIDKLDPDTQGQIDTMLMGWAARASEDDWKTMSLSDRKGVLNKLAVTTAGMLASAELVNMLSGAAVSDEEFQRYQDAIFGGGLDRVNLAALRTTLGSTVDSLYNKGKTQIENIGYRTPYDKLDLAQKMEAAYSGKSFEEYTNVTGSEPAPGTEQSMAQVAKTTIEKEGEQAVSEAAAFGKNVVKSIFNFGGEDGEDGGGDTGGGIPRAEPTEDWSLSNVYNNTLDWAIETFTPEQTRVETQSAGGTPVDAAKVISEGIKPGTQEYKPAIQREVASKTATKLSKLKAKWQTMPYAEWEAYALNPKTKQELSPLEYTNLIMMRRTPDEN